MPPRYTEWLAYLFDHDVTHELPEWYWRDNAPVFEASPAETAGLWIAMMKHAETDLGSYSDEQVGQGLWYLFSNTLSDHCHSVLDEGLPLATVLEVYESLRWLYTGLFSRRCTPALGHLSEESSTLNTLCYMLWDVSPLRGPPEDARTPAIEKALFGVLEHAMALQHRACIESALHGLGELHCRYTAKVQAIIQSRLPGLAQDKALLQYALNAQEGKVQ